METRERLVELSRMVSHETPVVSLYLDTRWADEHQRERARVFLKNALRSARDRSDRAALAADLDWLGTQGERVIAQIDHPGARGVAFFACAAIGLRQTVAVYLPFEDAFVLGDRPFLAPLARLVESLRPSAVVFLDGVSARLIPLGVDGPGDEVLLEHAVEGRHRRGGWALLAQSRYERHIEAHRDQHFEAVARALESLVGEHGVEHVVLAGDARAIGVFRRHLAPALESRVAGTIPGARHESAGELVERAVAVVARAGREREAAEVDAVLTEAAKGGRAVVGLPATLEAVARGAVHRLYLARSFDARGEAIVERVLAAGGGVEVLDDPAALVRAGGVAARLRYPVGGMG